MSDPEKRQSVRSNEVMRDIFEAWTTFGECSISHELLRTGLTTNVTTLGFSPVRETVRVLSRRMDYTSISR